MPALLECGLSLSPPYYPGFIHQFQDSHFAFVVRCDKCLRCFYLKSAALSLSVFHFLSFLISSLPFSYNVLSFPIMFLSCSYHVPIISYHVLSLPEGVHDADRDGNDVSCVEFGRDGQTCSLRIQRPGARLFWGKSEEGGVGGALPVLES